MTAGGPARYRMKQPSGQDTVAASAGEREGAGELHHVLGQVDSANSTVRVNASRPIPLLAWTEMPLLKATM